MNSVGYRTLPCSKPVLNCHFGDVLFLNMV